MLLLFGFYLIIFFSYLVYICYITFEKDNTPSLLAKNDNLPFALINKFYSKYERICFYDKDGSISYIPEVAKLAEYIDYCNGYENITTPLDMLKKLQDIDIEHNVKKITQHIEKFKYGSDINNLIVFFASNDFIFSFKVLNMSTTNVYRVYFETLKAIGYVIDYDYFCFLIDMESKKMYLNKFVAELMDPTDQAIKIEQVDKFSGYEFELFCAYIFIQMNYSIEHTKKTCDFGADLVIRKQGVSYAVQCKRYSDTVSNKAIQEVVSSMSIYKCSKSIVVTNSNFSSSAIKLAKHNHVILIDRIKLINIIYNLNNTPAINDSLTFSS